MLASILWTAVGILVSHLLLTVVFRTTHTLVETAVVYVVFFFMVGVIKGLWKAI